MKKLRVLGFFPLSEHIEKKQKMFSLRKFSLRRSIDGENIDLKKRLKPGNSSCIETFYLKAHRSNQQQGINNVWQFIVYMF